MLAPFYWQNKIHCLINLRYMEELFELLGDIILNIIFIIPGAFIRWLIYGRRNRFKYYLENNPYSINAFLGFCTTAVIIVAISLI